MIDLGNLGYPVPASVIDTQQRWEAQQVQMGIDRYNKQVSGSSIADTSLGMTLTRRLMDKTVQSIRDFQQSYKPTAKTQDVTKSLVMLLTPEELAYITIKTFLTSSQKNIIGEGRKLNALAIAVGHNIKNQLDVKLWLETSKAEHKEGIRERDDAGNLMAKHGHYTHRLLEHIRRRFSDFEPTNWTVETKVRVGVLLVNHMVTANPFWLAQKTHYCGIKTEFRIVMTEEAKQAIFDINDSLEIAQPFLLPMLCPPKPWVLQ